jgi:hypothetical protein
MRYLVAAAPPATVAAATTSHWVESRRRLLFAAFGARIANFCTPRRVAMVL